MNKSYAKINLILEVLNKRSDGYHNIRSVVSKINLYDEIDVKTYNLKKHLIKVKGLKIPLDKNNLMIQVLDALKSYFKIDDFFIIKITKNISLGAGFGGGSSNAAFVIKWFLKKYQLKLDNMILKMLLNISSDINIFLNNANLMLVEGKGNLITPLNFDVDYLLSIIIFDFKFITKKRYQLLNNYKKVKQKINYCKNFIKSKNTKFLHNDFNNINETNNNWLKLKEFVKTKFNKQVFLTGKGPSYFMLNSFSRKEKDLLKKHFNVKIFECKTLKNNY